jgi:hypothetical protein
MEKLSANVTADGEISLYISAKKVVKVTVLRVHSSSSSTLTPSFATGCDGGKPRPSWVRHL